MKRVLSSIILNTVAVMLLPMIIYEQAAGKATSMAKAWNQKLSF